MQCAPVTSSQRFGKGVRSYDAFLTDAGLKNLSLQDFCSRCAMDVQHREHAKNTAWHCVSDQRYSRRIEPCKMMHWDGISSLYQRGPYNIGGHLPSTLPSRPLALYARPSRRYNRMRFGKRDRGLRSTLACLQVLAAILTTCTRLQRERAVIRFRKSFPVSLAKTGGRPGSQVDEAIRPCCRSFDFGTAHSSVEH